MRKKKQNEVQQIPQLWVELLARITTTKCGHCELGSAVVLSELHEVVDGMNCEEEVTCPVLMMNRGLAPKALNSFQLPPLRLSSEIFCDVMDFIVGCVFCRLRNIFLCWRTSMLWETKVQHENLEIFSGKRNLQELILLGRART